MTTHGAGPFAQPLCRRFLNDRLGLFESLADKGEHRTPLAQRRDREFFFEQVRTLLLDIHQHADFRRILDFLKAVQARLGRSDIPVMTIAANPSAPSRMHWNRDHSGS